MSYFKTNIEAETIKNTKYRKVVYTDKFQQLALMSLDVGEYIPKETHNATQFFRIEQCKGVAEIGGKKIQLKDGVSLVVPPGTSHKIINKSWQHPLKLYTIYSPPQHDRHTINKRQPDCD